MVRSNGLSSEHVYITEEWGEKESSGANARGSIRILVEPKPRRRCRRVLSVVPCSIYTIKQQAQLVLPLDFR